MKLKTSMAHHNETIGSDWYLKSRKKAKKPYTFGKGIKNRRTSGTFFDWLISEH